MIDAITAQHIERRRPASPLAGAGIFRRRRRKFPSLPLFNSIALIEQNPVHKKRPRRKKPSPPGKGFIKNRVSFRVSLSPLLTLSRWFFPSLSNRMARKPKPAVFAATAAKSADKPEPAALPADRPAPVTRPAAKPKKSYGLRLFSLVPAAALITLALFSFFALEQPLSAPVIPPEDPHYQRELASYAGLGPRQVSLPPGEEIPLDLIETFAWKNYTVKRGDSVSVIARNYAISMDAIIASNGITNVRRLSAGQTLRIPNMDGIPYTVKSGDSLAKIAEASHVPLEAVLDANDIRSDTITPGTVLFIPGAKMPTEDLRLALGELFIYPIRGRLSSPFGWRNDPISGVRRYHAALDLAAPEGTTIKASMDGKVATVGLNSVYGRYIILSHSGGYQTMYAHLSRSSVTQGSYVNQGSKIGEVGNTGYSTGPHLHFAIYKNGRAVDPSELLAP
jgi:murein DD-endopeptidase MepM/ murein hydrolase activator NlpD